MLRVWEREEPGHIRQVRKALVLSLGQLEALFPSSKERYAAQAHAKRSQLVPRLDKDLVGPSLYTEIEAARNNVLALRSVEAA